MSKRWSVAMLCVAAMAMSILISACGGDTGSTSSSTPTTGTGSTGTTSKGGPNCVSGSLTASGSTALAPLVQAVAKDYQAKCSGASITVNLGGSKAGLTQAEGGQVQVGNSDVAANKLTQPDLVDHQVAVVIYALVLNSKVTGVTNLTTDQVKKIYSGEVTNWKQVGGPDLKIVVVSRPATSGTRATFQKYILGGPEKISGPLSLTSDSTGTVSQNVKQTDGAIGYVTIHQAKKDGYTPVTIDNNAPTSDLVKSNTYKFWAIEHMYTKGEATGLAKALIDYVTGDFGKQQAQSLDFIGITDMTQAALDARK